MIELLHRTKCPTCKKPLRVVRAPDAVGELKIGKRIEIRSKPWTNGIYRWHDEKRDPARICGECKRMIPLRRGEVRCPACSNWLSVWQDMNRIWITVEEVYETRWDCPIVPAMAGIAA